MEVTMSAVKPTTPRSPKPESSKSLECRLSSRFSVTCRRASRRCMSESKEFAGGSLRTSSCLTRSRKIFCQWRKRSSKKTKPPGQPLSTHQQRYHPSTSFTKTNMVTSRRSPSSKAHCATISLEASADLKAKLDALHEKFIEDSSVTKTINDVVKKIHQESKRIHWHGADLLWRRSSARRLERKPLRRRKRPSSQRCLSAPSATSSRLTHRYMGDKIASKFDEINGRIWKDLS